MSTSYLNLKEKSCISNRTLNTFEQEEGVWYFTYLNASICKYETMHLFDLFSCSRNNRNGIPKRFKYFMSFLNFSCAMIDDNNSAFGKNVFIYLK